MRIWLLSDLHTEYASWEPPEIREADICVALGDVARGAQETVEWLAYYVRPHMEVIGLLGNHEFYGHLLEREQAAAQWHGQRNGVMMLDDMTWTVANMRFVGATLWTDFDLDAKGDEKARARDMANAQASMRDYSRIGLEKGRFTPATSRWLHQRSVAYLDEALGTPFDGDTVVLTHHAPHPGSVHERYDEDSGNSGWVSDLTWLIEKHKPSAWMHGHVHDSFDYEVAGCRIIANPRGYGSENLNFDPSLVVEIGEPSPRPRR